MARKVYTVVFGGVAATAQQDLFEITPADDRPIEILGLHLSQTTELGDAAEEQLRIAVIRGHTTSGSGGSAPTPQLTDPRDSAAGFTAEVNNTTIASAGTSVTLHEDSWNVRVPYAHYWPPECAIGADQGNTTIVVRLLTTPADSITINGTLYVRER